MAIPKYAADLMASSARIEQKLDDHIKYHNGISLKRWYALGSGIGSSSLIVGAALAKLAGLF